ncbi:hypothetical protein [Planobispora rosea]|uniref:hypothetical protein n=1 Tax=Planobispora rosea TaxID=35762 RepID=UPI00083B678D|nr:hypothetical protein [Planobispora rosea]
MRTWRPDGRILAAGLLDGAGLLRLAIAPDAQRDGEVAQPLVEDVTEPERGVLGEGRANVEAPTGALAQDLLFRAGCQADEPWMPLRRDLMQPVKDPRVRIDGPTSADVFCTKNAQVLELWRQWRPTELWGYFSGPARPPETSPTAERASPAAKSWPSR